MLSANTKTPRLDMEVKAPVAYVSFAHVPLNIIDIPMMEEL